MAPRGSITPRVCHDNGARCGVLHGLGPIRVNMPLYPFTASSPSDFILSRVSSSYTRHSINEAKWNAQHDRDRRQGRGTPSPEGESGQNRGQQ
ncbi:hypothetical protein F4678DRAFT_458638 [Xylaria arbuscula]|nr:hypothetical protein F4678DRAFT_458638 [Xylaria arbuscula]